MSERLQEAESLIAMLSNDMDQHDFTRGYLPHWRPRLRAFLEGRPATYDPKDAPPKHSETRADGDVAADTGHAGADRIIARLASSDTDFDDCTDAAVLIRRLVADAKGPDGYATWKDAAVAERMRRIEVEKNSAPETPAEPKVGDEVTITIPLSEGFGGRYPPHDGWKISRIDRTTYVFLSHPNGSEISLFPGQFALKSTVTPSASTDDNVPPSRSLPSSVECPKCRTQLAFEGDECGLCKEDEA